MENFSFNFDRTLQAAAYLLKKAGGRPTTYLRLIKMLYIADREYLAENGYTITGDQAVAMQYGPVLSHVFDLVRGKDSQSDRWQESICTGRRHGLRLVSDPGTGDLSRLAVRKLDSVFERYGNLSPHRVVELTHNFPEWQENYREMTSTPIGWRDILRAQGKADMESIVQEQIAIQRHCRNIDRITHASR
jgi:uncharacterized phage-associated protein